MWFLYKTVDYVHLHLDQNKNTPTMRKRQVFLISYLVSNLLNYTRLTRYNRKVRNDQSLKLDYTIAVKQREKEFFFVINYQF